MLIDCGDSDKIIKMVEDNVLDFILFTRCHQDHVYGLSKVMPIFPKARVYCSQLIYLGLKRRITEFVLIIIMSEYPFYLKKGDRICIIDEENFIIGGFRIEALSTPSHSDDCMSYIIDNEFFT